MFATTFRTLGPRTLLHLSNKHTLKNRQIYLKAGFSSSSLRYASAASIPTPPPLSRLPNPDSVSNGNGNGQNQEKKALEAAENLKKVHQWIEKFKEMDVDALRHAKGVEMTFSRSSGPGGQNVNKVNTKATVHVSLNAPWIPTWSKDALVKDPHYVASSNSILVTSSHTRSQAQNIDDSLAKIHDIILHASTVGLRNPTSEETKKRVEAHIKADKERTRQQKDYRSSVKKSRSGGPRGGFDFT